MDDGGDGEEEKEEEEEEDKKGRGERGWNTIGIPFFGSHRCWDIYGNEMLWRNLGRQLRDGGFYRVRRDLLFFNDTVLREL